MQNIKIKRIYEPPYKNDGFRILIDRMWPRGLTKEKAHVHLWIKDIAPTPALRKWFHHNDDKFLEFKDKYYSELKNNIDSVNLILRKLQEENNITLLYSSKNEIHNNAVVLKSYLESI